jgi:predicted nucleotidyltransferase
MKLPERYKNMLLNLFEEASLPMEVWAYGSRVYGGAHPGSDLDLVVVAQNEEPLPFEVLNNLQGCIRESNIPILVELRDFYRLPESFQENIEAQHEVIFSNVLRVVSEPKTDYKKS